MTNFIKATLVAALVFSQLGTVMADRCINEGEFLNLHHSIHSESVIPYSHLLPNDLPEADSLSVTYDLKLKPIVNDLTQLQFQTYDSRSPAAGYTSPYLWDVGQGPGYRNASPFGPIPAGPGLAPNSPFRR